MKLSTAALVTVGLALTSACARSNDPVYTQFFRPVGAIVDDGTFGRAQQNNTAIQSGERDYTYTLATRFAEEVNTTVNFAFNSAQIDAGAAATLRVQADWINQFPEVRFKVFGHTDLVGGRSYNKRLGQQRANAVVNYLVSQGVDRSRLQAVVSVGEAQPLIVTEGRERRNRRTVTEVTGFLKRHPTVLDGRYAQIIYRDYVASAKAQSDLSTLQQSQVGELGE